MNDGRRFTNLQHNLIVGGLLLLIVVVGGYFRYMSLNWDDFASLHPDERFLTRNLLPLVGGSTEFTNDVENFPPQVLLVSLNNLTLEDSIDLQLNDSLRVGAVQGQLGAELADWWLQNPDRIRLYDSAEAAAQAISTGDVAGVMLDAITGQQLVNSYRVLRVLQTFESPLVQRLRCEGLYPDTGGVGGYFDTFCSSYNPYNAGAGTYAYGTLPLFLARGVSDVLIQEDLRGTLDFQGETLVWRFFSAFFDVGTIILIFLIGRRLHNSWVGLLAAVLYAAMPLPIEKAHFGTVNAMTAFFVALALWAAVHVQSRGRFFHFVVFGIACGAALSGRINTAPLAGVVVLAAMVYALPVLDSHIPWAERERILWRSIIGVMLAGIATLLTFRIFNPYAFTGPTFFHIIPSARWLADVKQSSVNVSGIADIPPNWQWLNRSPYLFPLKDMLLWGMGLAAGIMAWFGFGWAGYRIARGRKLALQNIIPFVWVLVYFAWIGKLWVMTMRYYLPLYSALALLAGWAIYELARRTVNQSLTRTMLGILGAVFMAVPAYALYHNLDMTTTLIASGIVGVVLIAAAIVPIPRRGWVLATFVIGFTLLWGLMYTNIYRNQVTRVQAARWVWENVSGDLSAEIIGAPEGTPLINLAFYNQSLTGGKSPDELIDLATNYTFGRPYFSEFTALASGTIESFHAPHLADPLDDPEPETYYVSISWMDGETPILLAETTLVQNFSRENHPLGDAYDLVFDEPVTIEAGQDYMVKAELISDDADDKLVGSGAVMLTEGDWDDRITTIMMCELAGYTLADNLTPGMASYDECNGRSSYPALLQSYDLAMSYPEDAEIKRENIIDGWGVGDYFAMTSNRFYDTETRNPARWPLTTFFYDALFEGELGYELVATVQESYEFGPLSVADQHLPTYDSPQWLNELEADEAFHVYDHPVVFIFRKQDDYNHERVTHLLNSISILRTNQISPATDMNSQVVNSVYWASIDADIAPTALELPDDVREIQQTGGTWSERFDSDSLLNTNQVIGVIGWWAAIVIIGWATFPILFVAFPKLADRGYNFAKIMGLFIVGWLAYASSTAHVALWNQSGLLLLLLLVAAFSALLVYKRRAEFSEFIFENRRRLLIFEAITLGLFLLFITVRLSNPDLWHHPMGGEKPMDFAYFNATLRSTVFPAYDPWYADGYINYYYVGYVLVGIPVLLLKMIPAFAYNLIVPTLFALTSIGAFSVAFNIVARNRNDDEDENADDKEEKPKRSRWHGNPWLAGVAALMLCVVLGNLDVPRVLITEGVARLGGYTRPQGMEEWLLKDYEAEYGVAPDVNEAYRINQQAANPSIFDNLRYEIWVGTDMWSRFFDGLGPALSGQTLPIGSNRWYWAPTRILNETPGVLGNAINEMPAFTFIYGDLHAHMVNMPLMLFAILFVFYEVRVAQNDNRRFFGMALAVILGAFTIGMFRAINTWDFPSFMVLAVVGLTYAWWQRWQTISRASLLHLLVFVGGFGALAMFAASPYTEYFASLYNSVQLWEYGKTPFWAYFDIYGLFLFLIVSLLLWDTVRGLRVVHVRDLDGRGYWILGGAIGITVVLLGSVIAAAIGYQVALIVMPLIIWIALLFFRPEQSEVMRFVLVIIGFALALTLGVEVVVIVGDIGRQNTVFKFYIQVWLLLSVAGGVAFAWLIHASGAWANWLRVTWVVPLAIMVTVAGMFPVMAIRARMLDRFAATETPLTLNGMDYMQYASHWVATDDAPQPIQLANDYNLIRWLQENVQGTPVIIEGRNPASEYRYNARISINTGLPSVLGWNWHQRQQRTISPLSQIVEQRERNIKFFYQTTDIESAVHILQAYQVRYIIVSDFEMALYAGDALAKFEMMNTLGLINIAHEYNGARIYEVLPDQLATFSFNQDIFFSALGIDGFTLLPYAAEDGLNERFEPYLEINVDDAIQALTDYEIPFVTAYNLPQLQAYAPDVYNRLLRLESLEILDIVSDTTSRRIYRVNRDSLAQALDGK